MIRLWTSLWTTIQYLLYFILTLSYVSTLLLENSSIRLLSTEMSRTQWEHCVNEVICCVILLILRIKSSYTTNLFNATHYCSFCFLWLHLYMTHVFSQLWFVYLSEILLICWVFKRTLFQYEIVISTIHSL